MPWFSGNEEMEAFIDSREAYARERISPDCVKIFLDGVPTDSHTAAMLEPYEGHGWRGAMTKPAATACCWRNRKC